MKMSRAYPRVMTDTHDSMPVQCVTCCSDAVVPVSGFVRYAYRPFDQPMALLGIGDEVAASRRALTTRRTCSEAIIGWFSRTRLVPTWSPPPVTSDHRRLESDEQWCLLCPHVLRDDGLGAEGPMKRRVAPTCPPPPKATSKIWARMWRTCSTTSWPCSTTHLPRGQRRGTPHGVAAHPPPGLARRGRDDAAAELAESAARGRELAALLDTDTPVPGVTEASLRAEIAAVAVPSTTDGGNMTGDDFALTAGWGHFGQGEAVMPGQGRVVERPSTPHPSRPPWARPPPPSATPPSTYTSTTAPTGATSPPPSGTTSSAATRSSRNGSPTASTKSSTAPSTPKKSNTSPTPPAASQPY